MADVTTTEIVDGVIYLNHPDHRNNTAAKSQWTITEAEERGVFRETWDQEWHDQNTGWGLFRPNGVVAYVGISRDGVTHVFVAKFDGDKGATQWHGYPVDHRSRFDRPPEEVLRIWLAGEILPAAKVRKIQKGIQCKL